MDKGFEIQALTVLGRANYLSVTEASNNTDSLRISGEETIRFLKT